MSSSSREISSFQQNGGTYGYIEPDISVSFTDSQWLAEVVRTIYLMADNITLCFTPDNIFIFLCTNSNAAVPFYSCTRIDAEQLCFYQYRAMNYSGELYPFVGVTFSATGFYKNITSKVKHTSMDMYYYVSRRNFVFKHPPKSPNSPESITYGSVLNVECCIHNLPFVAGRPDFQFDSNNISTLFTSAAQQSCYYVRIDVHNKGVAIHGFNNFGNMILSYSADFLPEGCKGTVTFSTSCYDLTTKPYITLCISLPVIKVLSKIGKITPQGANIGVYLLPQIGVIFLEISLGVVGKNYIGLQTSTKFEDKALQPLHILTNVPERTDEHSLDRPRFEELGNSDRVVDSGYSSGGTDLVCKM